MDEQNILELEGNYVFLKTDSRLPQTERIRLTIQGYLLYRRGLDQMNVEGLCYEGVIFNSGERKSFGPIEGQVFTALLNIETQGIPGSGELEFIVSDTYKYKIQLPE